MHFPYFVCATILGLLLLGLVLVVVSFFVVFLGHTKEFLKAYNRKVFWLMFSGLVIVVVATYLEYFLLSMAIDGKFRAGPIFFGIIFGLLALCGGLGLFAEVYFRPKRNLWSS